MSRPLVGCPCCGGSFSGFDVGIRRLHPDPEQLQRLRHALLGIGLVLRKTAATASASESLSARLARRDEVRAQDAANRLRMEQAPRVTAAPRAPQPRHEIHAGTSMDAPTAAAVHESRESSHSSVHSTGRLLEARRRAQRRKGASNR